VSYPYFPWQPASTIPVPGVIPSSAPPSPPIIIPFLPTLPFGTPAYPTGQTKYFTPVDTSAQTTPPVVISSPSTTPVNSTGLQFVSSSDENFISEVIFANEGGAYSISHAPTQNSGFSVGHTQIDLSEHPAEREQLISAMNSSGSFTSAEISQATLAFESKGDPNALSASLKAKIDTFLLTPKILKILKQWDNAQLAATYAAVETVVSSAHQNPLYGKDAAFTKFVDSPLFKAYVGDNYNQLQAPQDLITAARTQDISFTFLLGLESKYLFAQKPTGAADLATRRGILVNIFEQAGAIDKNTAAIYRQEIKNAFGANPPPEGVVARS
jgi:hypothetical protein